MHCNVVEIDLRVPSRWRHRFLQYVGNFLRETVFPTGLFTVTT